MPQIQKTRQKKPRKELEPRRDVGALVFLIEHALGDFEVMSPQVENRLHARGKTLDQAWGRYYKIAERAMRKQGTIDRAHPDAIPETEIAETDNIVSNATGDAFEDI